MAPSDALRAAAALLADPSCRAVGAVALDARGMPCRPRSARAARWDPYGALRRVTKPGRTRDLALGHLVDAADHFFGTSPEDVNDDLSAGEASVLEMFGHAVVFAERSEIH